MRKKLLLIILLIIGMVTPMNTYAYESTNSVGTRRVLVGYKISYKTIKKKKKTKKYLGKFTITHYCPCSYCCGYGGGTMTASGTRPKAGRTVGVNPSLIPYGTKLKIGGKEGYVAEDTGALGTYHIDVFVNSHQEAINKGVQYKKVWIIKTTVTKKKKKIKTPIYKVVNIGSVIGS